MVGATANPLFGATDRGPLPQKGAVERSETEGFPARREACPHASADHRPGRSNARAAVFDTAQAPAKTSDLAVGDGPRTSRRGKPAIRKKRCGEIANWRDFAAPFCFLCPFPSGHSLVRPSSGRRALPLRAETPSTSRAFGSPSPVRPFPVTIKNPPKHRRIASVQNRDAQIQVGREEEPDQIGQQELSGAPVDEAKQQPAQRHGRAERKQPDKGEQQPPQAEKE